MTAHTIALSSWSARRLLRRLRSGIGDVNAAHAARCRHAQLTDRDLRDIGLSRDDVLGTPRYQPHLPFFMQHGF